MSPTPSSLAMQLPSLGGSKKSKADFLRVVDRSLLDLDHSLGETVVAMDKGEVSLEDLAWEAEFASSDGKHGR